MGSMLQYIAYMDPMGNRSQNERINHGVNHGKMVKFKQQQYLVGG